MGQAIIDRTRRFALDMIILTSSIPAARETRHVTDQLLRASSSVAANYRAAFRARSKAEFLSKLGIAEEEADETLFWLELLRDGLTETRRPPRVETAREIARLLQESDELL